MGKISLKKNYLYSSAYEVLVIITPLITAPYISRVLGAEGVGIYSYVGSLMHFFTMFASLGTASYGMRETAQHRDQPYLCSKIFCEIEIMTVFTSAVCLFAWLILCFMYKQYTPYLLAEIPSLISVMLNINWFFTGHEKIAYTVLRGTIVKLSGIVMLFLFVKEKTDVVIYILINTGIGALGNLGMWSYLPKMLVKVNYRDFTFKKHFKETLVYFIPTVATSVYTVLDKSLIGIICNNAYENGYYEQATRVINIINSFVYKSVNAVMGARMAYLFSYGRLQEIKQRISRSIDFIYLLGFGSMFGICSIADIFVPVFFGDGYSQVVPLIYLMAPLVLIVGTSNCLGSQYYNPSGQRKKSAKYIVLGACINLFFNLILIPRYGAYGATVASVIAEMSITFLYVRMSDNYLNWSIIYRLSWKRIFAGIIMFAIVRLLGTVDADALAKISIQIFAGALVYGTVLLLLRDKLLNELIRMAINSFRLKR